MATSRERLIWAVGRYAKGTRGGLTLSAFCRAMKIGRRSVSRGFPGGWGELLRAAKLSDRQGKFSRVRTDQMLEEIDRVARMLKRVPASREVSRHGRFGMTTINRRLGTWDEVMRAYRAWKKERGEPMPPMGGATRRRVGAKEAPRAAARNADGSEELMLGEPLGFGGVMYAPTNELGVVHLFGVVGRELGLVVEHVGSGFPDCRARRVEPWTAGKWRRIAVEFELRSSNFEKHGHDASKCDLIVCWEHDWPACPVEVMELKSEIRKVVGREGGCCAHALPVSVERCA